MCPGQGDPSISLLGSVPSGVVAPDFSHGCDGLTGGAAADQVFLGTGSAPARPHRTHRSSANPAPSNLGPRWVVITYMHMARSSPGRGGQTNEPECRRFACIAYVCHEGVRRRRGFRKGGRRRRSFRLADPVVRSVRICALRPPGGHERRARAVVACSAARVARPRRCEWRRHAASRGGGVGNRRDEDFWLPRYFVHT